MKYDEEVYDISWDEYVKTLQKHSVWNYSELVVQRPQNKYEIIKGHQEWDPKEALRKAQAKAEHWHRDYIRRNPCLGEGSCHGSLGYCHMGCDVSTCDVEWPYWCDVHEKYPTRPPVAEPPPRSSEPFLPGFEQNDTYVAMVPQPYWGRSLFGDLTWIWQEDRASKVHASDPTTSRAIMQNCPYPVGLQVGSDVVEKVSVVLRGTTWYWKLDFQGRQCEECKGIHSSVKARHLLEVPADLCSRCYLEQSENLEAQWMSIYSL